MTLLVFLRIMGSNQSDSENIWQNFPLNKPYSHEEEWDM